MMISICVIFVASIFYLMFTWQAQKKFNRCAEIKPGAEIINFGSTYAYYDLDYEDTGVEGCNLANVPQYFDMDFKLLKKYAGKIRKDAKCLFVLPDFVFAGTKTKADRKIYYEIFHFWELPNFNIKFFLQLIMRAATEPFTHHYENIRNKWKGYVASPEEKKNHAAKRVLDWEKNIGIPSVKSDEITPELSRRIEENKILLTNMIKYCRENKLHPVLLIPPVSGIMKKSVSDKCLEKYLFNPAEEISDRLGVRLLNYYFSVEFENIDYYLNSDCMNECGRKIFTRRVLQDLNLSAK